MEEVTLTIRMKSTSCRHEIRVIAQREFEIKTDPDYFKNVACAISLAARADGFFSRRIQSNNTIIN